MLTFLGAIYLVGAGICVGISIGFGIFVTFITLGSKAGMELAGKIVLHGTITAVLWPIMAPYRMMQGKFGR
ncbi:hypothetical protein AXJ18_gp080 [Streptomyces phage Jay2Jay]|uniref:Uncharacterized protein n=2 Tax=Samistivirus jay2jay TaxID=2560786 RepID=A0A221SBA3_9CAUD|nr:hypothetical protein AXJ18_gp080 [Streptomyces phage Jay2Jay]AIW02694.1 hypothetical protein PBI_JAY2JAY_241 [Streptomyces phage Jay2Jay]ASN73268.1 hypothetical protein SEA_WARPY_238 [Streptomyces phage Warpy]